MQQYNHEWRLRRVVPAAAVATHTKPHAQQQLARDLEVERAAMGQRCRHQAPGLVSCVRVRIQNFLFHFPFDEIYRRLLVFTLGRSVSA